MRSASTSLILLLASGVSAAVPKPECLVHHSADLARYSECGHHESLNNCLSRLQSFSQNDVEACYVNAGCPPEKAGIEVQSAFDRCADVSRSGELRKRARGKLDHAQAPQTTAPPVMLRAVDENFLFGREGKTGSLECKKTSTVSTTTCPVETNDGKVKTGDCVPTTITEAECAPGLLCDIDSSGQDICMELHNSLDIGGMIIAIVFAVAVTVGIGTLTFLCIKDGREQKRLAAKAEATALARAATRKKRTQDQRTPLMRQHQQDGASTDPFADRDQS